MDFTNIGENGINVSRIGLGCWQFGGHGWGQTDDKQSIALIRYALDSGINIFDTADCYGFGHSEDILFKALGKDRETAQIATKFGVRKSADGKIYIDSSPAYMRKALEGSLRRLGLNTIPLYYVHWLDGVTPIAIVMDEMLRCKHEGKIKAIGFSNPTPTQLLEALQVVDVDVVQIEVNILNYRAVKRILSICLENDISVISWGSLCKGLLTGKFTKDTVFSKDDNRSVNPDFQGDLFLRNLDKVKRIDGVLRTQNISLVHAALRWLLDTPGISSVLCGVKTVAQLQENINALHSLLSPDVYTLITELAEE